jgi:hypothetical protein
LKLENGGIEKTVKGEKLMGIKVENRNENARPEERKTQ